MFSIYFSFYIFISVYVLYFLMVRIPLESTRCLSVLLLGFILSFSRFELNSGDFIAYRPSTESIALLGMQSDSIYSLYFLKEFLFWFPLAYVTNLLMSFDYAVYFWDAICVTLFIYSFPRTENRKFEKSAVPFDFILFSFVAMMGFANTYRQNFGLAIFLTALHIYIEGSKKSALFLMFLSIFIHNVFLGFFIIFILSKFAFRKYTPFFVVFSLCIFVISVNDYLANQTDGIVALNGVESGFATRWILSFMLFTVSIVYISIRGRNEVIDGFFRFLSYFWISVLVLIGFFEESTAIRLFDICLIFVSYLSIYKYYLFRSSLFNFNILLTIFFVVLVLPAWTSPSSVGLIFP